MPNTRRAGPRRDSAARYLLRGRTRRAEAPRGGTRSSASDPVRARHELQQRESRYRIIEIDDGATLCAALANALGIRGTVVKRRRLLLWRSVRIHLDEVEQLGTFIELEAVAPPDSGLDHEHQLIAHLRDALGITDERLVALGYAEQLIRSDGNPRFQECSGDPSAPTREEG